MSLTVQPNALNQIDIEYILSLPEVISAKQEIDSKKEGAILFTIKLTQTIKSSIFKKLRTSFEFKRFFGSFSISPEIILN